MQTILDTDVSSESSERNFVKAASAPNVPLVEKCAQIRTQISAPSYLFSLKENDAPPFRKPDKQPKPHLLLGTIMCEEEAIEMIAAAGTEKQDGVKKFLGQFLVKKNLLHNYNLLEKSFLVDLLIETIDYAAQRDFSAMKLAGLLTLYLSTHLYFKWYYWSAPADVWSYFKEIMIRHTIQDSPDGQELFEPDECYDIATHFHSTYISNLPLVHILTFNAYRLKFVWPFKPK